MTTEPATQADLLSVEVNIRRDIAAMAQGIGTDIRAIKEQLASQGQDIAEMRQDIREIRQILARGIFRWPWEPR